MAAFLLLASMASHSPGRDAGVVTHADKKKFLALMKKLPTRSGFFTEEAVKRAGPHLRVLLALTREDIEKEDLYGFLALSAGLSEHKRHRDYVVKHFGTIAHPELKLAWGAMLFDKKSASAEVVKYLRAALESKEQSKTLSEMLGPEFKGFKKRVKEYKGKGKE